MSQDGRSAPRQQRHSQLNDILWRAFKRAPDSAVKELVGLTREEGKRPDGVTVPDTYADSHIANTATTVAGAAADKAASTKKTKYRQLANSYVFVLVTIETGGPWNHLAVELTQELSRRITAITDDPRETGFLFQRLSVALQRGSAVSFRSTFTTE